ncbi:hypothetical protein H0H87_005787 [Tephrocybe sp. NHM501043]|nr:hypothetical protein H0H87_005787 [Tephrocybe sp. NHM501043]
MDGSAVARVRKRRNADVSPGYLSWERVEKRNAESPKPDMTRPVDAPRCSRRDGEEKEGRTTLSGNVFDVEFTAAVRPALPPVAATKRHNTNTPNINPERDVESEDNPESKMCWMPRYPTNCSKNDEARRGRGPCVSTSQPHRGAVRQTPTIGGVHQGEIREEESGRTGACEPDDVQLGVGNVEAGSELWSVRCTST